MGNKAQKQQWRLHAQKKPSISGDSISHTSRQLTVSNNSNHNSRRDSREVRRCVSAPINNHLTVNYQKSISTNTHSEQKNNDEKRNSFVHHELSRRPSQVDMEQSTHTFVDYENLMTITRMNREEISELFNKFKEGNPSCRLNRSEFVKLYNSLRPEPPELLNKISEKIFCCFDLDSNGYIEFTEFLLGYALTSRGDLKKKLEFCFKLYDNDNNGYLDEHEVKDIVICMLYLFGLDSKKDDLNELVQSCMKSLDTSNDGLISKDEFIDGLMKNYYLRGIMSPFN